MSGICILSVPVCLQLVLAYILFLFTVHSPAMALEVALVIVSALSPFLSTTVLIASTVLSSIKAQTTMAFCYLSRLSRLMPEWLRKSSASGI